MKMEYMQVFQQDLSGTEKAIKSFMKVSRKKSIVLCSNYAWTIFNFRLPLIKHLRSNGFKVILLTQYDGYEKKLANEVDSIYPLFISRKGLNPIIDAITILNILITIVKIKPDLILTFSIKPVIYGSLVGRTLKVPVIAMITGLGTGFLSNNWITMVIKSLYKIALSKTSIVFFQNSDDKNLFLDSALVKSNQCRMTPGSGVDLEKFSFKKMPIEKPLVFLLIARMLKDKGIYEFVEAAKRVKRIHHDVEFQLLGPLGVQNRTAISNEQMQSWVRELHVSYLGETDDVRTYIKKASCIILPSYREGTSRVLLEACSIGRPIIATNVPGCKEVVDDGINGFICKPKDSHDLANKILKMLSLTRSNRVEMGKRSRKKVENTYSHQIVNNLYLKEINEIFEA